MIKLNITNNAWKKMFYILKNNSNKNFILSASSGGCSGFNYNFKIIDNAKYNNIIISNKFKPTVIDNNGVNVIIDPSSEFLLLGTTIDYITEDFTKGIFSNKFSFTPNKELASSCGCGISFNPKK
jgi:iron-sulfur cluster insertion protein